MPGNKSQHTSRTIYVERIVSRIVVTKLLQVVWPRVVFSSISPLRFGRLHIESLPGPKWVRVANKQCGICGTDLTLARVAVDPTIAPAALPGTRRIYLGHEIVGIVTEVGPAVTKLAIGDRVIMDTRFQGPTCLTRDLNQPCIHCLAGNYMLCEIGAATEGTAGVGGGWSDEFTCHESELFKLPHDLSDDEGMFVEPLSTSVRSVLRAAPKSGEKALIYGTGFLGLNIIQCLRAMVSGCHITAVSRYAHQALLAERLGASAVLHGEEPHDDIAIVTGARLFRGLFGSYNLLGGFEVVYDCVGSPASLKNCLRWTRAGGTVVLVGLNMMPMRLDLSPVWHQEVNLIGVLAHGAETYRGGSWHTYNIAIDLLRQEAVQVTPLITHRLPLSNWRRAITIASDKQNTKAIKVVLDINDQL